MLTVLHYHISAFHLVVIEEVDIDSRIFVFTLGLALVLVGKKILAQRVLTFWLIIQLSCNIFFRTIY